MMRLPAVAALVALGTFAGCSNSKPVARPATTAPSTNARHAVVATPKPTTTTISPVDAAAAKYNPTHDPTKCVRLLPDGNVALTLILLPAKGTRPNPAETNKPTVASPPFGKCG
jgi:hypothetical protein